MREITFRGRRIDNGEWVYGDLINGNNIHYYNAQEDEYDECEVYIDSIGQFIGINDKNGKKIFEGDTISSQNHFNKKEETVTGKIYYDETDTSFKVVFDHVEYQIGVDIKSNEIEVIKTKNE